MIESKKQNILLYSVLLFLTVFCLFTKNNVYYPLILTYLTIVSIYYFQTKQLVIKIINSKYFNGFVGLLLGFLFFVFILGLGILNINHIDWLFFGGDSLQHYIGWNFFHHEQWNFPLGKLTHFGYPVDSSVVFTDSIPILALIFKVLSPFLPYQFQYFGIWMLICYLLQGYFGMKLMGKITSHIEVQILGTMFFIVSPIMLYRFGQESLMAQWVILAALLLLFNNKFFPNVKWILLIDVTLLIHFYLSLMVIGICFIQLFNMIVIKKIGSLKKALVFIVTLVASILCVLWLIGYFVVGSNSTDLGFGIFSFNY